MGGLVDKVFGSRQKTSKNPFSSEPWKPAQSAIMQGINLGSQSIDGILGSIPQDLTADLTPEQINFQNAGLAQARQGARTAGQVTQAGLSTLPNIAQAGNNSQVILDRVMSDPVARTQAMASGLGGDVEGIVDTAIRDAQRVLQGDQFAINSAATGTGNINSTRAAALEARAMDNAQDRVADISSSIRFQDQQAALDRAMALDGQQTGAALAANDQLLGTGTVGAGLTMDGSQAGMDFLTQGLGLAGMTQQQAQAEIEGAIRRGEVDLNLLNQYMNLVGRSFGSSGFQSTSSSSPSLFQQVAGATIGAFGAMR